MNATQVCQKKTVFSRKQKRQERINENCAKRKTQKNNRFFSDDPLSPEIAQLYRTDKKQHDKTARQWTNRHAAMQ